MTRVRCISCGNVQDTYGKWFYNCNRCSKRQSIENSEFEVQATLPENVPDKQSNSADDLDASKEAPKKISPIKNSSTIEKSSSQSSSFEIQEVEAQEPKIEQESEEQHQCPECGAQVEVNQQFCPACKVKIIWSDD